MTQNFHSLVHHFLLPTPQMDDPRFFDTLIYICHHNTNGAWGFIVNQPLSLSVAHILGELELPSSPKTLATPAMRGGVISSEAGFVLHTGLPEYHSSFAISDGVCLTTSKDILHKISHDTLSHYLLCMGFCRWDKGQLTQEITQGDWFSHPANLEILFNPNPHQKLIQTYQALGITPHQFIDTIGHA